MASGVSPRRGWLLQRSARVVRLMRASSVARERLERLHAVLRSSLNAWKEVLKLGGRSSTFGCCRNSQRWVEVPVAPQARWKLPADFWRSSDGFWMDKLVCGGLVREFAGRLIFGQKKGKVFVVLGLGYGELLEWGFGCWRGGVLVSS